MSSQALEALLAHDGPLTGLMSGYHARPQQHAMAEAVEQALGGRRHLIVEAGTGVGKSLGYLLPAALWAVREKKKVVVATYTKALQEQLLLKDLPVVGRLMKAQGLDLDYALLMGSENYLCAQRLDEALEDEGGLFEEPGQRQNLSLLAGIVPHLQSGLRSTLPVPAIPDVLWHEINRDPDLCLGRIGPHWKDCAYRKDTEAAKKAHVLVVNQHLLFAGLPEWLAFDALIVDEAHNLEGVAAQFLGFNLTSNRLKKLFDDTASQRSRRGLLNRLKGVPADWRRDVERQVRQAQAASTALFDDVQSRLKLVGSFDVAGEGAAKRVTQPKIVEESLSRHLLAIDQALTSAASFDEDKAQEKRLFALARRYRSAAVELSEFMKCERADHAYWAELRMWRRTPVTELHMIPLDVSQALRQELFEKGFPVILTSATLTVAREFDALRGRIGLDVADELLLDSPFDYPTQAGLLVATDVPDPVRDPRGHEDFVANAALELAKTVPGGIFLLFSSWKLLNAVHRRIAQKLGPRPVFKQGTEPAQKLLDRFKEAGDGVLFGADTFWQGVDVVGPALSAVVITKLPFPSPDSPIEEARAQWLAAKGEDSFHAFMLPSAVIRFRQGFGRLIRSMSDRGVVVVLDPRVQTKGYGSAFLRSLPNARRLFALADVPDFFAGNEEASYARALKALVAAYPGKLTPAQALDILKGTLEDSDEEGAARPKYLGALSAVDRARLQAALDLLVSNGLLALRNGRLAL